MQNTTVPELTLLPIDGVLLKADYLARRRRAKDITDIARQEASRIIAVANREADVIKKNAREEGFGLGVQSCADIIAGWASEQDRLYGSLLREFREQLYKQVLSIFDDVASIRHLADRWVNEQVPLNEHHEQRVYMRSHHSYKKNHALYEHLFASKGMTVSIEYSDDPGFHFRCGQFVMELSPDSFAAVISEKSVIRSRLWEEFSRLNNERRRLISEKLTEL